MILSVPRIIEKCVSLKDLWMIHWKPWLCKGCKIFVPQIFVALYEGFVGLPSVWMIGQLIYVNAISKTTNWVFSVLCGFITLRFVLIFFLSAPFIYWIRLRFRSVPNLDRFFVLKNNFAGLAALPRLSPFHCFWFCLQQIKHLTWKAINHSYSLRSIKYVHSKPLEQY